MVVWMLATVFKIGGKGIKIALPPVGLFGSDTPLLILLLFFFINNVLLCLFFRTHSRKLDPIL